MLSALPLGARLRRIDWAGVETSLSEHGHARTGRLLTPDECARLRRMYSDDRRFRKRIDMGQHRFGVGEYKYFNYPLPPIVTMLRADIYARLAPIANGWMKALGSRQRFPGRLDRFLARCGRAGQTRPTPLILKYDAGGYNCLHQDLYGDIAFPLQVAFVLSRPGTDYTGGEFLLVEQRPRAQSVGHVVAAEQGEMIVFANNGYPVTGARRHYRAVMRHGVSRLLRGSRYTLGVIFHDAA